MLFCEPIYKYPPLCGTLIKALTFIPKDIYLRDLAQPNPDKLSPIDDALDYTMLRYTSKFKYFEKIRLPIPYLYHFIVHSTYTQFS